MIGNDIIDLTLARKESNWQRRGWLQKLFSDREEEQIWGSGTPELKVWQFWSMKEAAYKAHQRRCNLSPKFNPRDFQCITDHSVGIDEFLYTIQTEISFQQIYSTATSKNTDYLSKIYTNAKTAKCELKKLLANLNVVPLNEVVIQKDMNRIPYIEISGKKLNNLHFSLTSHGGYSAFIIDL